MFLTEIKITRCLEQVSSPVYIGVILVLQVVPITNEGRKDSKSCAWEKPNTVAYFKI